MNRIKIALWLVGLACAVHGVSVFGQSVRPSTADKYIISAKAGGVNYVQGTVAVSRTDGTAGTLIRGDRLEIGDKVMTNAASRTEILLNPGSYMRAGSNSEFAFLTTALDDLQVRLAKGSVIFEVFATEDFKVSVLTPKGRIALIDSGVYRVEIRPDGVASVAVTEGKAQIGSSIVRSGRVGTIGNSIAISKFDRGQRDEMDEWSRSRAKDLAKVTASLKQKDIRPSLINSLSSGRWGMYDSFGLWIYNPSFGAYSFLPFGNRWNSPYGFGFGYGMDWWSIPWWNRYPVYVPRENPNAGPQAPAVKERRRGAIEAPPYTAVEKQTQRQTRMDNPNPESAWPTARPVTTRSAEPVSIPQAPVERTEAAGRTRGVKPID